MEELMDRGVSVDKLKVRRISIIEVKSLIVSIFQHNGLHVHMLYGPKSPLLNNQLSSIGHLKGQVVPVGELKGRMASWSP